MIPWHAVRTHMVAPLSTQIEKFRIHIWCAFCGLQKRAQQYICFSSYMFFSFSTEPSRHYTSSGRKKAL